MNKIITARCDCCGTNRTPVRVVRHENPKDGTFNQCRVCDPEGFEIQARADIDAWLRGDPEIDSHLGYA